MHNRLRCVRSMKPNVKRVYPGAMIGKRLIFFSDRTGKNQIYTMKQDGSDVHRIAATESNDNSASWSPDNTKIAFTSDRVGNSDIYVMDANGRNVHRLTNTPATERAAAWSPDGRRLVFSSDGDGPSTIYTMNADGSHLRRLEPDAGPTCLPVGREGR